jgi:repressor LexA
MTTATAAAWNVPRPLTDRQKSVLKAIGDYIRKHGFAPTCREIATQFDVQVPAMFHHFVALERAGYIERLPRISRGIRIVKQLPKTGRKGA